MDPLPPAPTHSFLRTSTEEFHEEDTDGVAYHEVSKYKHYEIERYECPAVTRRSALGKLSNDLAKEVLSKTDGRLIAEKWYRRHNAHPSETPQA